MDYKQAAGQRLAGTRRSLGLSREGLAGGIAGLDAAQLARYESGEEYPPHHILRRLAAALEEAPDFLGAFDIQLHRFAVTPEGGQQAFALQRIAHHIRGRMGERGLDAEELARRCGIGRATLAAILEGREDASLHLCGLARVLRCSVAEILCGCFKDSQSDFSMTGGMVPLLSWREAARSLSPEGVREPPAAAFLVCCPLVFPDGTFALKVRDNTMAGNPRQVQGYPRGTIIYVAPAGGTGPQDGDRVVARTDTGALLFRAYHTSGGDRRLVALNPAVAGTAEGFRVLGKVIGAWHMKGEDF